MHFRCKEALCPHFTLKMIHKEIIKLKIAHKEKANMNILTFG